MNNTTGLQPIYIHVTSFADLITNSSSEVFVSAREKTLDAIKSIVSNILKLGGSEKTAEDLFDITLVIEEGTYENSEGEDVDFKEVDYFSKEGKMIWLQLGDSEYSPALKVKVDAKDKSDAVAKSTAKILSKINDYFNTEERYS